MKFAVLLLAACSSLSAPAVAAAAAQSESTEAETAVERVDPANLELADRLVAKLFPTEFDPEEFSRDFREGLLESFAPDHEGEPAIDRAEIEKMVVPVDAVLRSHAPRMRQAYVATMATGFSRTELQELLTFVSTPTGQRFLGFYAAIESSPAINDAQRKMYEDLTPAMEGFQTAMCQRATKLRIAAGDTTAKCSRA